MKGHQKRHTDISLKFSSFTVAIKHVWMAKEPTEIETFILTLKGKFTQNHVNLRWEIY